MSTVPQDAQSRSHESRVMLLRRLDVHDHAQLSRFAERAVVMALDIERSNGKHGWTEHHGDCGFKGCLMSLNYLLGGGLSAKWVLEAFDQAAKEYPVIFDPVTAAEVVEIQVPVPPSFEQLARTIAKVRPDWSLDSVLELAEQVRDGLTP